MTDLPFPLGSRVCGYVRDSGGAGQELSTAQQEERLGEFCREHSLAMTRVFGDAARSGKSAVGRSGFLEMVDYLSSGAPELGVILWSYSRFSRQYDDAQYYLALIRRSGKLVISITDQVPDNLEGRLLESVYAYRNAKFREELGRDVSRGLRYILDHYGAYPSGPAPTGYLRELIPDVQHRGQARHITRIVPDPDRAPFVRRAFEMRAAGASIAELLQALPELNMSRSGMRRMMYHEIYTGRYRERDDFCTPLVDAVTWEQAQKVNGERAGRMGYNHPRRVNSSNVLTGLLRCGRCGLTFNQRSSQHVQKRYSYYECISYNHANRCGARRIRSDRLEPLVINLLLDQVLTVEMLAGFRREIESQAAGKDNSGALNALRRELSSNRSSITRMIAAIGDAGHSPAMLGELKRLESRQLQLETDVRMAEARREAKIPVEVDMEIVRAALLSGERRDQVRVLRGFILDGQAELKDRGITGWVEVIIPGMAETRRFCL